VAARRDVPGAEPDFVAGHGHPADLRRHQPAIVATANQAGLLMAWILISLMPPDAEGATLALWLTGALAAGLVLCIVTGLITGILVAVMGVHPILVTLGTMTLITGFSIYFTRGRTLSGFPEPLILVSNETILGAPISFILLAVIAVVVHVLLTRTPLGIRIHMIGSNLDATPQSIRRIISVIYLEPLCWSPQS
jgi:simple sugar transport system permease protein